MAKVSAPFQMTTKDWEVFANTTLINLAPYLVAIIPVAIERVPADWAYATLTVFLLQRLWSFLKLYVTKHKI